MSPLSFRLLEGLQKIDDRMARARQRRVPDPLEIAVLRSMRDRLRRRLSRTMPLTMPAPA